MRKQSNTSSPVNPATPRFNQTGTPAQVGPQRVGEVLRIRDQARAANDQVRRGNR